MDFIKIVEDLIAETTVIGGINSCMGPNVSNTATVNSGDNWNKGDARIAKSLYGGVLTRNGSTSRKRKKKKR